MNQRTFSLKKDFDALTTIFFRNGENRRSDGKQLRGDSLKEIARIMALSDGSTLPSTRLETSDEERVVDDGSEEVQTHVAQQQVAGKHKHTDIGTQGSQGRG